MNPPPDVRVVKRKTLTEKKISKKLKKFLDENREREADLNFVGEEGTTNTEELLFEIPHDTLFQLQKIHGFLTGETLGDNFAETSVNPINADGVEEGESHKEFPKKRKRTEDETAPQEVNVDDLQEVVSPKKKEKKAKQAEEESVPPQEVELLETIEEHPVVEVKKKKKKKEKSAES